MKKTILFLGCISATVFAEAQGCFGESHIITTASTPYNSVVGDFNSDGKMDIAYVNNGVNNIGVLLGNGNGTFSSPVYYSCGSDPRFIDKADFNNDGVIDLVTANNGSGNASVFLGNGNGTFANASNFGSQAGASSVCVGDFNGDGNDDFILTYWLYFYIYAGNGMGGFTAPIIKSANGSISSGVSVDLNNDGIKDYAITDVTGNVKAFLGDNTLSGSMYGYAFSGAGAKSIVASDLNKDGNMDLVVLVSSSNNNLCILLGNGAGGYISQTYQTLFFTPPVCLVVSDFNNDSNNDLVVSNSSNNAFSVLFGNGSGGFASGIDFPVPVSSYPLSMNAADFTGDNLCDIIWNDRSYNDIELYINNPQVNTSIMIQTNASCNGASNGSATINASGGSGFTYVWSPSGGTSATASGLGAGTYNCLVTNSCGNTSTIPVTITEPAAISLSISGNTSICMGVNTLSSVSAIGGTGSISFNWMPGNLSGSSQIITPSATTVYNVTATDANNCTAIAYQTITVVNCPGPQLTAGSCGVTLTSLNQTLNFSGISGATNYKLEIIDASQPFNVVNVRGNNQTIFNMSWVTGIQYGRTYSVRIAAYVGGVWQSYGNTCTVTTPAIIPTTQFSTGSCNVTLSSLGQQLNFPLISGATNYKLQITNAAQPFSVVNIRNNTNSYFIMAWVAGIQYGRTYDVQISAYINSTWQPYGSVCTITTPATIPTTQFSSGSCGIIESSRSQVLNFDAVSGATNYKVEIVNATQPLNVVNVRNSTATTFNLAFVAGTQVGKTYDLRVAANVGGVWAAYGPMCQVTVGGPKINSDGLNNFTSRIASEDSNIENLEVFINVMPNPTNGEVNVESSEPVKAIMVYNISGKLIANQENSNSINLNDYSNGFYIINVKTETGNKFFRVIKE